MLPKNERRIINKSDRVKILIYGSPFSGKTTLADQFPDPLMLNTDGNLNSFTAPVVEIKERVEGRQVIPTWEVIKETINELQQGSQFKTIVIDLIEDFYEACRVWSYKQLNIKHESDAGFGKGHDFIRTEFLSTMKRLMTLNYNIVLLSHTDVSSEITKTNGDKITKIKPNISEKVVNKLAGMVDLVGRIEINANNERKLTFKNDGATFGGGRIKLNKKEIDLNYNDLISLFNESNEGQEITDKPIKQVVADFTTTENEEIARLEAEAYESEGSEIPENVEVVRRSRRVRG